MKLFGIKSVVHTTKNAIHMRYVRSEEGLKTILLYASNFAPIPRYTFTQHVSLLPINFPYMTPPSVANYFRYILNPNIIIDLCSPILHQE